jgi:hypothetical protein
MRHFKSMPAIPMVSGLFKGKGKEHLLNIEV